MLRETVMRRSLMPTAFGIGEDAGRLQNVGQIQQRLSIPIITMLKRLFVTSRPLSRAT